MTTMDTLMEFMTATKDLGEIYLTGDFNARTGSENQEPSDRETDDLTGEIQLSAILLLQEYKKKKQRHSHQQERKYPSRPPCLYKFDHS